MLRDYRMGQRLSGATIRWLLSDYRTRTSDYPANIEPTAATIPRLSSDYSATIPAESATIPRLLETRCPNFRAAFLIVGELAVGNQRVVPLS